MSLVKINYIDELNYIAVLTLNRPQVKHAFNTETIEFLLDTFRELQQSETVRVVILTSSTEDAFCTGADLKERNGMTDDEWKQQHKLIEDMYQALAEIKQPTIAAVNGYCLAGGFELALNSDLIIAGEEAKFGLTEVLRGIMPGGGGARLLPKRVPLHIAKEWLFTGKIISANEAYEAGLLNKLVPRNEVLNESIKLAKTIAENAPLGVQGVKRVADASTLETDNARRFEIDVYNRVIESEDRLEGILAFNEKRKPQFKGM
ncbi:MAG TPA: enoyl-CoA hydratase-related protein [Ureibacillus sp.]|nr:enoyl-CoA hydratase-related protein [Ureibacillus sp.]